MRKALLGALAAWLAGAGLALAQYGAHPPAGAPTTPTAPPPARGDVPAPGVVSTPAAPAPVFSRSGPNCGPTDCGAPCEPACCEQPCPPCGNGPCGPPGRFWVRAEYLLWWLKHDTVPPLVTTAPATAALPGALGPGTTVLLGDRGFIGDENPFSGARFSGGLWLDECQKCGIEGGYFFLGRRNRDETFSSSGAPGSAVIARPFFNTATGRPDAELVAFPGLLAGSVTASTSTRLQGAEANVLHNLCCCDHGCEGGYRVDLIGGFRYLDLDEDLTITEDITVLPTSPILTGNHIGVVDEFRTRDRFYGGQVGVGGEVRRGRLFADARALIAFGETRETVDISGTTTLTPPGGAARTLTGGLLALPTNIGHHTRSKFAVVPEADFNIGYQVTQGVRVFVGYTFLYWSNVVRPGDVINTTLNPRQIPTSLTAGPLTGPAQPAFQFRDSDFWAQGVNFGVEFRF